MLNLINSRILISGATVLAAAALIIGATFAFFSDTETSTDNTFVAGDIDLKIDNTSYAIDHNIPNFVGTPTGALVASTNTSWTLIDLTIEKFFDFVDLKPGDIGEDTISIHVGSNDAWMCAAAQITEDEDNDITEPEDEVSGPNNDNNDGTTDGDLDSEVNFAFWVDDGDNVFEPQEGDLGEPEEIFLQGPISGIGQQGQITLADFNSSILGGNDPIPGETTFFIGKAWCFGNMTLPNGGLGLTQDGTNTGSPLTLGTGFVCDGSGVGNIAQTDSVVGDLQFFAVQSRNNSTFTCAQNYIPSWD